MVERKTKRTRIVHGKKVVGNSGENEQNSTLFVRNKIAFFSGQGESSQNCFALNTITIVKFPSLLTNPNP